jgi:hypothetical protein
MGLGGIVSYAVKINYRDDMGEVFMSIRDDGILNPDVV